MSWSGLGWEGNEGICQVGAQVSLAHMFGLAVVVRKISWLSW